jgi:hypothetical protein
MHCALECRDDSCLLESAGMVDGSDVLTVTLSPVLVICKLPLQSLCSVIFTLADQPMECRERSLIKGNAVTFPHQHYLLDVTDDITYKTSVVRRRPFRRIRSESATRHSKLTQCKGSQADVQGHHTLLVFMCGLEGPCGACTRVVYEDGVQDSECIVFNKADGTWTSREAYMSSSVGLHL